LNTASITFPLFGEGFIINPPSYFTVFGFQIYYYGLLITAGYALAALYLIKRSEVIGLTRDNCLDLVIIAVPAGLVGARLYYIIFNFEQYFGPGNWQNILAIRDGGLAVYGGIILSGIAYIVYSRIKKIPIGKLLDAAGFGLFIGQSVGRWGNFFNREAFGVETSAPWRMGFLFDRETYIRAIDVNFAPGAAHYFHPTFLYEMLWNAAGLLLMHIWSKKFKSKYPGQYFLFYAAWYGFGRFMIEGLRVDSLFIHSTNIRASQLLALLSCITAVALLIIFHIRKYQGPRLKAQGTEKDGSTRGQGQEQKADDPEIKPAEAEVEDAGTDKPD